MGLSNLPIVGVAAIVIRDGMVLIGKRLGSHGSGTWGLPGGHLELGETPDACAKREVLEEAGLELRAVRDGPFSSDVFETGKHYITLFVVAECEEGKAQVLEPGRCAEWRWVEWDAMPPPLFAPLESLRKSGFHPLRDT